MNFTFISVHFVKKLAQCVLRLAKHKELFMGKKSFLYFVGSGMLCKMKVPVMRAVLFISLFIENDATKQIS